MTETELYTILTEVEASTNMRPLTATSEDVDYNNILPIIPSHPIIGQPLVPLPSSIESTTQTKKQNTKERWKERKHISTHYWNVWKEEYLLQLRTMSSRYFRQSDLMVGDVVLLTKELINKTHWPIAVVHAVLQG